MAAGGSRQQAAGASWQQAAPPPQVACPRSCQHSAAQAGARPLASCCCSRWGWPVLMALHPCETCTPPLPASHRTQVAPGQRLVPQDLFMAMVNSKRKRLPWLR